MIWRKYNLFVSIFAIFFLQCASSSAQKADQIHWLSFEELEAALQVQPKQVFIDFYTDWCTYCRKMDQSVFTKPEVIDLLNENYYAVRFDAETTSEVRFGGRTFINDQMETSRNPIHQIAQLLASREGRFAPPTLVILDTAFNVTDRYFEYMDSRNLLIVLTP